MNVNTRNIKVVALEGVTLPEYATEGSAGFDLVAHSFKKLYKGDREVDLTKELTASMSKGGIKLRPFERLLVGTGLLMEIPEGFELQIRPRSGNALKKGIMISNSPGTIDSDYRGEIGVILYNSTQFLCDISIGEKIAQAVLAPFERAEWVVVDKLEETARGEGGYGSTSEIPKAGLSFGKA